MAWTSEQELLTAMDKWIPLPNEGDSRWDRDDDAWADADRLIAAADAAGTHMWREVAVRVFEHAADWDLNGMMQSIRHGPERAFAPDDAGSAEFAARLEPLAVHERTGTRLWVVRELGILRQLSSLPVLVECARDPRTRVAKEAMASIGMLGQNHPAAKAEALRLGS